jgi:hypothetical protein
VDASHNQSCHAWSPAIPILKGNDDDDDDEQNWTIALQKQAVDPTKAAFFQDFVLARRFRCNADLERGGHGRDHPGAEG